MTQLLTHTVAHSTRPSFRPETNNQPTKKFLNLAVTCVKVVKMYKILTLKVRILPFLTTFVQLSARLKNFLVGWLLVLGLKKGLVECATVCVKSEVILMYVELPRKSCYRDSMIYNMKQKMQSFTCGISKGRTHVSCHILFIRVCDTMSVCDRSQRRPGKAREG